MVRVTCESRGTYKNTGIIQKTGLPRRGIASSSVVLGHDSHWVSHIVLRTDWPCTVLEAHGPVYWASQGAVLLSLLCTGICFGPCYKAEFLLKSGSTWIMDGTVIEAYMNVGLEL